MKERIVNTESLKEQEHVLHEKLIEQTHALQRARAQMEAYEAAIEMTMAQLQEVRQQLYLLWQHSP